MGGSWIWNNKIYLTDNGGEFSSDEMREVCSILDVQTLTTAAFSPFQNGVCVSVTMPL